MSNNTITITGNLGKPAEVRFTKSGKPVTTLNLGHTPRYKSGDEWVDGETLWFKVTVWEQLPEIVYDRGAKVIVTGELRKESWKADDGSVRDTLTINADTVGIVHRVSQTSERPFSKAVTDTAPVTNWPAAADETPF